MTKTESLQRVDYGVKLFGLTVSGRETNKWVARYHGIY